MSLTKNKTKIRRPPAKILLPFIAIGRMIAIVLMIAIITCCIVASVLTVYVLNTLDDADSVELENVKLSFTTILYAPDKETGEYYELQRVQNNENRIWIDYEDIPDSVKNAAIAVEDKRFWSHSGVDFRRTIASAVNLFIPIYEGTPGGSTITQQVIRNITGDDDFRIDRKLREIFRAISLEKKYSKEQILEVYLNTIALGNGQNGVQSASNLYFNKDVRELSIAEAASLIAITQNPTKWNPFSQPDNNRIRQLMILDMMREQKLITQREYETAKKETLVFKREEYAQTLDNVQNWFIDTVYEEVLADLVSQAGYTEAGATKAMRTEGFQIYTTMDKGLQDMLEAKYLDPETFPTINNPEYPESAFVILDPANGEIKAIVGSNRPKEGARVFNRATSAVRHPGSTIKPLSAYTLSVEYNYIHWSMIVEDSPILLNENDPTSIYPRNFYNSYYGNMTIKEALQRSTNTIAVKLIQKLTPRVSFDFMRDSLCFKHLVESESRNGRIFTDIDLAPMALGGLTDGVTPLEMAAGFQIFGNGGLYNKPHSYTKVLDSDGNVILENKYVPARVISVDTASIMNKLLQQVTSSAPGTGTPAKFSALPIAGKTGTSDNDYNQWFIGVTPYYVGVCYLGYDIGETINYRGYYYPPPLIWKNVMSEAHKDLPIVEFEQWGDIVQSAYCAESGDLAGPDCTLTNIGWYKTKAMPEICTMHNEEELHIDDGVYPREPGDSPPPDDPDDPLAYWRWLYNVDGARKKQN